MDPSEVFTKLIAGHSVVFVGPARTLLNTNMGSYIDSFDTVVRTNGAINLASKDFAYQMDYGKRTTVLCSNVQFHRETGPFTEKQVEQWKKVCGLHLVNFKNLNNRQRKTYNEYIPVRTINYVEISLREKIQGVLMGPIIITDILNYAPKNLYLTGMDFYYTKPPVFIPDDYREYYPNYLPGKIQKRADVVNRGRIDPHDKVSNTKYIYDLYKQGKLDMDDEMKKLSEIILKGTV